MKRSLTSTIVGSVVLLVIAYIVVNVVGMLRETGSTNSMLNDDILHQKSAKEVAQQLFDAGFTITSMPPQMRAEGPKHSIFGYTTWITIDMGLDKNGDLGKFHIDRAH